MPREDRSPGFTLYPNDFLNDPAVVAMSDVAFAGYTRLWLRSWDQPTPGVIRYDPKVLGRLSGLGHRWKRYEAEIAPAFDTSTPGVWRQERTVRVRQEQINRRAIQRAAGLVSACKRGDITEEAFKQSIAELQLPLSEWVNRLPTLPLPTPTPVPTPGEDGCVATPRADALGGSADMRGMVLGLAASKKIERPRPKNWRVDPADAWAKAKALGPRAKIAMQLVGFLGKHGAGEFYATCALAHFVENHATIENPFAYYSPKSDNGKMLETDWSRRAEIDHARKEQALTEAWLRGRNAA